MPIIAVPSLSVPNLAVSSLVLPNPALFSLAVPSLPVPTQQYLQVELNLVVLVWPINRTGK